uniref:Putative secreted protein n=1 Tax=Ixodes ricinus TaxID=34613 RepID=V5GN69_IXORI
MKLLLIAVVICIHASGFLTTAEPRCEPLYDGGYGGQGGANVKEGWTFNKQTNHCQNVMFRSRCRSWRNCFPTKDDCEEHCDPIWRSYKNNKFDPNVMI